MEQKFAPDERREEQLCSAGSGADTAESKVVDACVSTSLASLTRPTKLPNGELVVKVGDITIRGKSTGGRETALLIEELRVAFDMGYQPDKVEAFQNILITHGHTDHIGCLHYCHSNRKLHHITLPWQIVMPSCYILPFKLMCAVRSSLGRGGYPIGFVRWHASVDSAIASGPASDSTMETIKPFDKIDVDQLIESEKCVDVPLVNKSDYRVTAYKMAHKITAYGYVIAQVRQKLKKEFLGHSGPELKELRAAGVELQEPLRVPVVAFSGDTTIDALLGHEDFLRSRVLIMECTHLDGDTQDATANGHVHLQQFLQHLHRFQNQYIVLCHLSQKYKRIEDLASIMVPLSAADRKRLIIWL